MQLVLTEKDDILRYIDFLSSEGKLEEAIGSVTLSKEDTQKFLNFSSPSTVVQGFTPKRWSAEEDLALLGYVDVNTKPEVIAELMDRSESSVRSRANKKLRKGFNHDSWYNLTN